jgi:15-cis-phytoene desaturase
MPVEVMRQLLTPELLDAAPGLAGLRRLKTRWMNGIMFYLHRDVPLVRGHSIYIDSPWSLTSISQAQFWPDVDLAPPGGGQVAGILSVDISDWTTNGVIFGKPAMECTRDQVAEEVWAQLKQHLNRPGRPVLEDGNRVGWFLDDDIVSPNPHGKTDINLEPLLINTVGSWQERPDATTSIANLLLASDYVRTCTDLATMEGANEAARRAVNGILDAVGSDSPRCTLWPLTEPAVFTPWQQLDRVRFRLDQPHISLIGQKADR